MNTTLSFFKSHLQRVVMLSVIMSIFVFIISCNAEPGSYPGDERPVVVYENSETGYVVMFADFAEYMPAEEEARLLEDMKPLTDYCNVVYFTYLNASGSLGNNCESFYLEYLGANRPGVMFAINPHELYIYAEGSMSKIVTNRYATSIADNVYEKATVDDYYGCAADSYHQIMDLINNKKIPEPMKYITNTLLGLLIAFFLCFIYAYNTSKIKRTKGAVLTNGERIFDLKDYKSSITKSETRYSPRSSSSGGHGGRGGGGGHSHSGGGHSR